MEEQPQPQAAERNPDAETQGHSPSGLENQQGGSGPTGGRLSFSGRQAIIHRAFALGYASISDEPSERAVQVLNDLTPFAETLDNPLSFMEEAGAETALDDRLRRRHKSLSKKYGDIVQLWAQRLAVVLPADVILKALQDKSGKDAIAQRKRAKRAIVGALQSALEVFPDLELELRSICKNAQDEAAAEGKTAAGAAVNFNVNGRIPNLKRTHDIVLGELARADLPINTTPMVKAILSGLAGDLALHLGPIADQIDQETIRHMVAIGTGAVFYLLAAIHSSYAAAQVDHLSDAGQLVNFTTMGDGKVEGQCLEAAASNPYRPEDVPPIPLHAGCRCWYTAAGTAH